MKVKPKRQRFAGLKTTFSYGPQLKGYVKIVNNKDEEIEVWGEDLFAIVFHVIKEYIVVQIESFDIMEFFKRGN